MNKLSTSFFYKYRFTWTFVLLIFLALLSFALHVNVLMAKTALDYDETISYLVATCQAEKMAERPFTIQVESVSLLKQLITEVDEPFCFSQITHDMAAFDIHPPLYFWLLHGWFMLLGVHFWSGTLLNSILAVGVMLILFKLAMQVLGRPEEALIVVFAFVLNPSVFLVSMEARQYELLVLWTLLFVWLLYCYVNNIDNFQKRIFIAIFLVVIVGALTHFLFLLPLTAGFFFVIIRLWQQKRELLFVMLTMLAGYFCAWTIFPYLFKSVGRVSERVPEVTWENFLLRIQRVGVSFASFYYVFIVLIFMFVVTMIYYLRHGRIQQLLTNVNWQGISILFFPLWIGSAIIAQYLLFLTPTHAMGSAKYFSMVWPFLAFLPVFILRVVQYRRTVLLYFLLIPFIFGLLLPLQKRFFEISDPTAKVAVYPMFLVDSTERGVLLQLIWVLPKEASVLIMSQEAMLADNAWMSLLEPRTLYLSDTSSPDIAANREEVLSRLAHMGFSQALVSSIQTRSSGFEAAVLTPP